MAAALGGTYLTTATNANAATGLREDLVDKITRIDPEDTPFYSNDNKSGAAAIYHEWLVQHLAAPAANAQVEGFETTFVQPVPAVRLGNYCQIAAKNWSISGTLQVVDKAGRGKETVYQQ